MKFSTLKKLTVAPAAIAISMGASSVAAQEADAAEAEACADEDGNGVCDSDETPEIDGGAIIVSGSRIARASNLDAPVPITSVEAGELIDDGALSLGDALNDLPSLRSTFSTSNSQRFIGTTGVNFLDLRGLGTSRTLTLVNGRRHVTASAGDFQIDVNTIPFILLDRVDIVTGGSSAVYGSDAIAGVVNFVLQRDFEGFEVGGQAGISDRGDNSRYSLEGAWGKNFADGRGNIAIAAEYSRIKPVLNVQRPEISGAFIGFEGFVQTDPSLDDEGETNSDGIPDLSIVDGLRLDFISDGGTLSPFCIFGAAVQPLACDDDGNDVQFRFTPSGNLVREDNQSFPGTSNVQGGTGSDFGTIGTLIPNIERYNINLLTHFDVSDAFRPYGEFKYARIEAQGAGTPSFINGICGGLGGAVGLGGRAACYDNDSTPLFIDFDNAFLTPQARATAEAIQDELLVAFGFPPNSGAATGFTINRNNIDFGARTDDLVRETYRVVVGAEGDISSNTRYDISFNYGRFTSNLNATNNLVFGRLRNAADAQFANDGSGNIVCGINNDADTTNDDPACAPINLFGVGGPSPEAIAYINSIAELNDKAEQYNVLGYIATDSSNLFELPGGPVSVVVGGEWRKETAFSEPDELSASGVTFFNAFDVFDPPSLEVLEGFGEIEIPILANTPGFEELTLSGAARYSDYNSGGGNTGGVWAYNGNLIWAPIPDIKFRANFSRAVRAPTLSNLFAAQTQNFVFLTDPCDDDLINEGPASRVTNCRADGVPVGYDADQIQSSQAILQGGNQLLSAETSDSITLGAVFEPSFVPGLAFTVDYYDIQVDRVIANVGANAILFNCYDGVDLNSSFCGQINPRNADGTFDDDAALITGPVNFARLDAEGIDFDLRYDKTFDNDDRLALRLIATHVLERTNFLDVDNPTVPNVVRGELGDPKWAANFNASYRRGDVTFSYSARFVDKMFIGTFENTNEFTIACPEDGVIPRTGGSTCTPLDLVTAPANNPDRFEEEEYSARLYHDVRLDFRVGNDYRFYFGVDNLTDKAPPRPLTGSGAGSGIYDNIGRYFYAGFGAEF
jgi:outer membrane receptor protein involved in Fe transport